MEKKKKITLSAAWREARDLIYANRHRLALGLLLMVFNRVVGLVLPASSKYLIDEIIVKRREELLVPLAIAAGAATMLQAVSSFALSQVLGVAAQRAITEMRKRVMRQVTRLPLRFFDSTQTGKLISRVMNDAEGVRNLVGSGLVQLFGGVITAILALVVLFYLNWQLTLLTILVLSAFAGGMAYSFKKLRPLFRQRGEIYSEVTGRLGESLGGIRVVKAYTAEKRETLEFARGAHRLFRNIAKSVTGVSAAMTLSTVVIGAIGIVIIIVGGRAILAGEMTLGDFVMYVFFTGLVAAPMVEVASIGTQITEAFAGLDRIREIMNTTREDEDEKDREPLGKINGDITFENVSFEYNEGEPVLKNVSLHAPAGTTTALVGSSGSGKSTLISLVMSFNYPKQGRILLDGRDLQRIRLRDYRAQLGVVLQDNFLFDGTIAENISFSNPDATREQIIEVSRIANCEEFINGFEKGYDTIVGERGVKLSGGQRQRIAIARAILADPKILILDEATSSLDSESEALIQEGLKHLRKGRTTFVIAHRLSTIQSADQILVLENGEIIERGKHRELLALNGRYRQLYDKQYRFERDLFLNPGEETADELPATELPQSVGRSQGVLEL
ncbi:MAG TPA: ABC transporter ATP-binding protein [Blastocatellia bacterium]|nr:ABC transporter ATP-binding protein [Blastocatellia bacterium]